MEQSTAIDKAIDVLVHLRAQGGGHGVTAVADALAMPKSSAHRLLATLCRRGLVERDEQGHYRLGTGLLSLALGALEQDPLVIAARPVLEAEAHALAETCFLVAARAGRLVVLDKAEGTGVLRASPRIGSDVPIRATSAGKLYLALAPQLLNNGSEAKVFQRFTDRTLRQKDFDAQLSSARRDGYAVNVDEWIDGLSVFSAPVTVGGRLCGVIAMAIPTGRMLELARSEVVSRVLDAASRISTRMEGTLK